MINRKCIWTIPDIYRFPDLIRSWINYRNSFTITKTELSLGKLFLLVQANYVGLRYTTETNDRGLQPYFVVDLTCGITYGNQFFDGGIKFSVKNLFNENYETMVGYPMPLRSFLIELSLAIKNKQKQKGEIK